MGLCAWLVEKLEGWSGRDEDGLPLLDDDAMLDVVSLYWLTRTGTSAARLYFESLRVDVDRPVRVPSGCTVFPHEFIRPPRAAVERRYSPLLSWAAAPRGGHFPATEVPTLFAEAIRSFAALLPHVRR
jgi:hypothetical protein